MSLTFQVAELTAETDANGYIDHAFDSPVDQVMVSVNSPQGGPGGHLIGASASLTSNTNAHVRVFKGLSTPDVNSVGVAASMQVTITLLGITAS